MMECFHTSLHIRKNTKLKKSFFTLTQMTSGTRLMQTTKRAHRGRKIVDPKNNQIIHLSPLAKHPEEQSECISFKKSGDEVWYQCLGNRSFYSRRPRWWYLALANCDSSSGLYLEYSILMTNAQPSNRWFFHFSFDEFYVLPLSILFLVIELIILIITVVFTYLLRSRNMFHPTFKVYLNSVIIDFSGLVAYWIHYDRYADNGKGFPMLKTCGMLLRQIASILFCLLLLLMAKGYTITRGKLSSLGTVKLMVFMTLYLIGHIIMLVWEIALFDPAEVTYVSESAAAYVIASLRLLAWLWCLYSSFMTVKKYPQKKIFYIAMGFLMTIWFWAGPVALVIANYVLDNWVRSEVMLAVDSGSHDIRLYCFLDLNCASRGES
ncbi:Transmembrane protein [Aphelenchoides bicaudatus]|nr:Transmembrane protein [Aphelenchoides bicaudatus]